MRKHIRPQTGIVAIGVFCMTVLTGIGGTSAYALWQQSSVATMTVRAAVPTLLPAPEPTPTSAEAASPTPTPTATTSPTATATATATPSAVPAALTLTCSQPLLSLGGVDIAISGAGTPERMYIAAMAADGSYGPAFALSTSTKVVSLTTGSEVIKSAKITNGNIVIKVTTATAGGLVTGVGEYDHVKIGALVGLPLALACG